MSLGEKFYHVEVVGDAIMPVIKAISSDALTNSLLSKYGLENVEKGRLKPGPNATDCRGYGPPALKLLLACFPATVLSPL